MLVASIVDVEVVVEVDEVVDLTSEEEVAVEYYTEAPQIVEEVFELLRKQAEIKKITIESTVDPQTMVFCDPNMISLVIRHLVSNGIQFTQENGKVLVCSTEKNKLIESNFGPNLSRGLFF